MAFEDVDHPSLDNAVTRLVASGRGCGTSGRSNAHAFRQESTHATISGLAFVITLWNYILLETPSVVSAYRRSPLRRFGHHPGFGIDWRHTKIERATGITHLLKFSTFTVGYLGMQVLAVRTPATKALVPADEVGFNFGGKARDAVLQISPVNHNDMHWPPAESLSGHELDDWAAIFKDPNQPEK